MIGINMCVYNRRTETWLSDRESWYLEPKSQPAPRGLTDQSSMSSGSDHIRSQKEPSCGISCFRSISRIWSNCARVLRTHPHAYTHIHKHTRKHTHTHAYTQDHRSNICSNFTHSFSHVARISSNSSKLKEIQKKSFKCSPVL
jgi:hypothetical protein